jgi:iron complex outermembrane receptor protein
LNKSFSSVSLTALALIASFFLTSTQVIAADMAQADPEVMEEVITIGTRGKPRSTTDSTAPVDVVTGDDILQQGGMDTSNLLRNLVPSFNVNDQPISDAATLVRPANLRGLAPDHTLVMVNGRRRHRAAVITWLGNGLSDGSQGADIGAIPSLALRSVEVLRDGAAAQYGSDAIAGVINFNLKDSASDGAFEIKLGEYAQGDGTQTTFAVNKGFAIGSDGFINLTAEWAEADATDRSVQRQDAANLIAAGYQNVANPAQVWGTPEVADDYKLWANFGGDLTDNVEFFGNANYNSKEVTGGFYYRNPTNRGGVYARTDDQGTEDDADDISYLLFGDLTPGDVGQDNSAFPALSAGDGVSCDVVQTTGAALADMNVAADANANCFNFQETIPGGFTPNFGGEVTDYSLLVGLRGETDTGIFWSVSAYTGSNEADFFINNTVNASLGPLTPRNFDAGSYEQEDMGFNADFSMSLSDDMSLAFGAEYRIEEFSIGAGQPESYIDGGLGEQGFSTSTNGFPGFSPAISGSWERKNYAVYGDLEWTPSEDLLVAGAVRFEDFDTFGTTTNVRVGANYAYNDNLGFRATVSTGFKAPTPGQSNASNISTQIVGGVLTNQGVIPSTSGPAALKGGDELDPEESLNFTLGVYGSVGEFDFTVDYFDIDLDDRLSLSSDFALSADDQTTLQGQGIDASDISEFRFFTNQFDTNTSGIDAVISTETEWLSGITNWSLAYNRTSTSVTRRNADLLGDNRVQLIEDGVPNTRWVLTAAHDMGQMDYLVRVSYYGKYYDSEAGGVFDDAMLVDFEMGYDVNEDLRGSFGVRNATNQQGCGAGSCGTTGPTVLGLPYSQFTPYGFNGAFMYGRLSYSF